VEFFKQAGQYSSHQTEGEFEQTNVEILCVCTILNRHRRGGRVVFRSVLKRTTLERLEKMHSNRQVTEHWKDIGAAARGQTRGNPSRDSERRLILAVTLLPFLTRATPMLGTDPEAAGSPGNPFGPGRPQRGLTLV
jgi:hypothetical protein